MHVNRFTKLCIDIKQTHLGECVYDERDKTLRRWSDAYDLGFHTACLSKVNKKNRVKCLFPFFNDQDNPGYMRVEALKTMKIDCFDEVLRQNKIDVNTITRCFQNTLLSNAIAAGRSDLVEKIVEVGGSTIFDYGDYKVTANVNQLCYELNAPILKILEIEDSGKRLAMLKTCIQLNANLNIYSHSGDARWHYGVHGSVPPVTDTLLSRSLSSNIKWESQEQRCKFLSYLFKCRAQCPLAKELDRNRMEEIKLNASI